jgi:hypothetical protein
VVSIHKVTVCPARAELSQNCCPPTHRFPLGGTTRSTSTASGQLPGFAAVATLSDEGGGPVMDCRSAGAPQLQLVITAVQRGPEP